MTSQIIALSSVFPLLNLESLQRREKLQKYLENENSFLDEVKVFLIVFVEPLSGEKKKEKRKKADTSFKYYSFLMFEHLRLNFLPK